MRDTTGIAKDVVSLGDVAVKLVDEKAGLDAKKKVLLIGTGEPAAMVAKTLKKKTSTLMSLVEQLTVQLDLQHSWEEILLSLMKFYLVLINMILSLLQRHVIIS